MFPEVGAKQVGILNYSAQYSKAVKGNETKGGMARTSGHYDALGHNTNIANLVVHAPVVEYF